MTSHREKYYNAYSMKSEKSIIVSNPKILGGKPIIAGTRISVELIMDLLGSGLEVKDILKEYPHLNKQQVQTAISFAASRIKRERIHAITNKNGELAFPTL